MTVSLDVGTHMRWGEVITLSGYLVNSTLEYNILKKLIIIFIHPIMNTLPYDWIADLYVHVNFSQQKSVAKQGQKGFVCHYEENLV